MSSLSEDTIKDYIDIDSIPPLPLHALMAAESGDSTAASFGNSKNEVKLFVSTNTKELKIKSFFIF